MHRVENTDTILSKPLFLSFSLSLFLILQRSLTHPFTTVRTKRYERSCRSTPITKRGDEKTPFINTLRTRNGLLYAYQELYDYRRSAAGSPADLVR